MSDSSRPWIPADQQPIRRVVGKRVTPPPGTVPDEATRAAMDANARHRTRAPKGLFFLRGSRADGPRPGAVDRGSDRTEADRACLQSYIQSYIETIDLDGVPLRVLNLEGLLLTKQGGRPKDRMDASILTQSLAILKSART